MDTKIVIKETERGRITCVLEDDVWKEILVEPLQESILHNIYTGKVTSVSLNMDAAFVSIGDEICYLPFRECAGKKPKSGDEIIVQVIKDKMKTKNAMVSCNLTISGAYFVLTTEKQKIGVSAKITDDRERKRLTDAVSRFLTPQMTFGVIVRTNAAGISEEILVRELDELCSCLTELCRNGRTRTCYSILYQSPCACLEKIRDIESSKLSCIITDSPKIYERLSSSYPVRFYQDSILSLDKLYRFETNISEAVAKKVWLKSGGYLVIEPTEALTVIDVNTGKYTGRKQSEETYRMINMEAAKEIARQLCLRNISGIIIVDFINMSSDENKKELTEYLSSLVRSDKVRTSVVGMTPLGLMEITRMKVRKPLKQQLEEAGYEIYKHQ